MAKRKRNDDASAQPGQQAAQPRAPQPVEKESGGLVAAVLAEYRKLSGGMKLLVWILLATHLPMIVLLINTLPLNFDVCTPPYQHMGMIARIVDGLPLYTGPSSEHSVVTYTPLYWVIVAMLAKVFGLTFSLARFVSVCATAAMWFTVAAFVWTNTARNLVLSIAAPAILFASSVLIGNWALDIHVNALHYALAAAGFFCLRPPLTNRRVIAGAFLLALCTLTKQTGLAYVAAAGFMVLLVAPKRVPVFAIVAGGIIAVAFVILQKTSNGEFYNQIGPANAKLPWLGNRIIDEILLQTFCVYAGIMLLFTIVCLVLDWKPNIFLLARQPHYMLLASGAAVAFIAHPKFGSGNTHDVIALAGLCICGCIGLHRVAQRSRVWGPGLQIVVPIAQLAIVMFAARDKWATYSASDEDRAKYAKIAQYFQAGRTCIFGVPYMQRAFNQPSLGIPDDEFSKWRNGRLDYSALPDFYVKPFRDEVFDIVIIADYFDPAHPACRAIMEHYPAVVEKIPATPPFNTYLRHEMYVLVPKRSMNKPPPVQPPR